MLWVGSGCGQSKPARPMHIVPSPDADTGEASTDTAAPRDVERFILGAVVPCDAPLDDVVYEEVGAQMGLQAGLNDPQEHSEGGLAAVADLWKSTENTKG